MEWGLQNVNHHSRLVEWGRRVEACWNSGQKVSTCCAEQYIAVSTYHNWQRKVFQAVSSEMEVYYSKLPVMDKILLSAYSFLFCSSICYFFLFRPCERCVLPRLLICLFIWLDLFKISISVTNSSLVIAS